MLASALVRVTVVATVALLLSIADPTTAADRFVSIYGDDTANDCLTSANPCATLVHTLTQAASGDVIKATQGPYLEELVIDYSTTLTLSGAWSLDFSSRDTVGHPSVLQGLGTYGNDLLMVAAGTGDVIDLTLDGFSINRGDRNVETHAQDDASLTLRFQNCAVKKSQSLTFYASAESTSTFDLTLSNCTVSSNRNIYNGVMMLTASGTSTFNVTLDDVAVERNFGTRFGPPKSAMYIGSSSPNGLNLVGSGLTVAKNGGVGMIITTVAPGSLNATLTNTQVRGNRDAGIRAGGDGISLSLTNGIVARNRSLAFMSDGGLVVYGGSYSIINSTIRGNRSGCCTGGANLDSGTVDLTNTIIWGNKTINGPVADLTIGTATVNVDHSDIGPSVGGTFNDLGGNITADPLFEAVRSDHLTAPSPAIDTGTCTGAPATDIDGDPRPSGGGCDMGADELVP